VTAFNADAGSAMASINVGAVVTVGSPALASRPRPIQPDDQGSGDRQVRDSQAVLRYRRCRPDRGHHDCQQELCRCLSAFTRRTGRIANSNGDVYFYWKSASAAWLSIRGNLGSVNSNAVQVRWR
jgi:hypothetical protein